MTSEKIEGPVIKNKLTGQQLINFLFPSKVNHAAQEKKETRRQASSKEKNR